MSHYAHSKENTPVHQWQKLEDHLQNVAQMADDFASKFGAENLARAAGLLHDVGKYSEAFQAYLYRANGMEPPGYSGASCSRKVDHSTFGAIEAMKRAKRRDTGILLSYLIVGHHGGLPNGNCSDGERRPLRERLDPTKNPIPSVSAELLSNELGELSFPASFHFDDKQPRRCAFQLSLLIRMLFSSLVDADYLDTEKYMDPERSSRRLLEWSFDDLQRRFEQHMSGLMAGAVTSEVNRCRREIFQHCIAAAEMKPGIYSLTVPTGGGKTLASLGFALQHAKRHGLERILYTMPFTSIIEQNAEVFREVLGEEVVLEHHSNVDIEQSKAFSKLATENWDAPLIVTTNVQLFNSLLSNKTSRTRKLHNIVGSVIVFDEAQALPPEHLIPCLELMRELVRNYRCSIVLCTATQPALLKHKEFPEGLEEVREIIPNPRQYFVKLKRVSIQVSREMKTDEELREEIKGFRQCLVVVNTRNHAKVLFQMLQEDHDHGVYHLSASMCPAHRTEVLAEIRERLQRDEPCRVVSTQLIEAGVDVDFPVVFRSQTGIDSIAQSAGRCNREGIKERGRVFVFPSEHPIPKGFLKKGAQKARETIDRFEEDLLSPEAVLDYFKRYYWETPNKDKGEIIDLCSQGLSQEMNFPFEKIGRFSLIEETTITIYVPYNKKAERLMEELRRIGPSRLLLRKLQPFQVQIYPYAIEAFVEAGAIDKIDNLYVLNQPKYYCERLGLIPPSIPDDPEDYIV